MKEVSAVEFLRLLEICVRIRSAVGLRLGIVIGIALLLVSNTTRNFFPFKFIENFK